jgi:hypothetical protein
VVPDTIEDADLITIDILNSGELTRPTRSMREDTDLPEETGSHAELSGEAEESET